MLEQFSESIPLTLFEKYFLFDTTPEFPMLVDGVLHFSGCADKERLETSLRKCLNKQPLLTRKIEKRSGQYYWVVAEHPVGIRLLDSPLEINSPDWNSPIDLFQKPGLEFAVYYSETETKLYYRCPHLCIDGSGFYRFLGDVLAAYHGEVETTMPPIVPQRILDRDKYQPAELPKKISFPKILYSTAKEIIRWMQEKPLALGQKKGPLTVRNFYRKTYFLKGETYRHLSCFAETLGWTVNDILTGAWFGVLASCGNSNDLYRLMFPVNMRWKGSEDIPAANIISYVFLSRKGSQCRWNNDLLAELHDIMKYIKDWQIGFMFLSGLRFFNRLPFGLRLMTSGKRCLATLVFSNVGNIEKFFGCRFEKIDDGICKTSNLTLTHIESYAPCRHLTNLSAVASVQGNKLVLCCSFDRNYLSEEDVDALVRDYEELLTDLTVTAMA